MVFGSFLQTAIVLARTPGARNHARAKPHPAPAEVLRLDAGQPRARYRRPARRMGRDRQNLPGDRTSRAPEVVEGQLWPPAKPREPRAERGIRRRYVVDGAREAPGRA